MPQILPITAIDSILSSLKSGRLVALPTETVFGLAVSLSSESAIDKLMKLKDRDIDSGKVFTLVPEAPESIKNYAIIPSIADPLIKNHIPGPLTLILPKNPAFKHPYFDNFDEIGLRIPDFPLFTKLLPEAGPLLLTSANLRGRPTYKTSEEIIKNLPVDTIVTSPAGNTPPSTILKVTNNKIDIIRQGGIIV